MMEMDPVCGMQVDPMTATAKSNYQGKTYYFCSNEDKMEFEKEPQRYVKPGQSTNDPMHQH